MQTACASDAAAHAAWSAGHGPGQNVVPEPPPPRAGLQALDDSRPRWRRFLAALLKHAGDWFRKCSSREIEARLAICRACDQFLDEVCQKCGCPVSRERRFRNKLAWRTEACPLGKWPALSERRWTWRTWLRRQAAA
jgi:hypothetical protein